MSLIKFLLLFFLVYMAAAFFFYLPLHMTGIEFNEFQTPFVDKSIFFITTVSTLLIFNRFNLSKLAADVALHPVSFKVVATSVFLGGLALFLIINIFLSEFFFLDYRATFYPTNETATIYDFTFLFVALVILVPITEELICRGKVYTFISTTSLGEVGAIVISSALFIVLHDIVGLVGFFYYLFLTVLLAFFRWKSGSVIPSIFMHATLNAVFLWFALFSD